jgi:hypothetical protein
MIPATTNPKMTRVKLRSNCSAFALPLISYGGRGGGARTNVIKLENIFEKKEKKGIFYSRCGYFMSKFNHDNIFLQKCEKPMEIAKS